MTSPYISRKYHELEIERVKRDCERRIADLQHQQASVSDIQNQNKSDEHWLYAKTQK